MRKFLLICRPQTWIVFSLGLMSGSALIYILKSAWFPTILAAGALILASALFLEQRQKKKACGQKDFAAIQGELLGTILSRIPCQVFVKDAANGFVYVIANKNFVDYYHLRPDQVLGHNDYEIFDPEVADQLRQHDTTACAHPGRDYRFDEDISFRRMGHESFKSLKVSFRTADGHPWLLGVCVDITDLVQMQKQLSRSLTDAQNADKAKSFFFASVSHEIRTPLNAVIGFSELLRTRNLSAETRNEYLNDIATAGGQLLSLINDVLDLSKLEAGQMAFAPVETDFEALVHDVGEVFRLKTIHQKIQLLYDIEPGLPLFSLDKLRLRQILFNLVGNAVKFTEQGKVEIRVRFHREMGRGTLRIQVSDTGIGISESDQKSLFQPFIQAQALRGTQAAKNGTGLGLAITQRLLERMNGSITLESAPGKGSTFTVILRDVPCREKTAEQSCGCVPPEPEESQDRLERTILAVDDVPLNLKVLEAILSGFGCTVHTASGADDALDQLRKYRVDAVLTDIWMPGVNGCALAAEIRRHPEWNGIRIAAISADVTNDQHFDMSHFDSVLSKPVTIGKLKDLMRKIPDSGEKS